GVVAAAAVSGIAVEIRAHRRRAALGLAGRAGAAFSVDAAARAHGGARAAVQRIVRQVRAHAHVAARLRLAEPLSGAAVAAAVLARGARRADHAAAAAVVRIGERVDANGLLLHLVVTLTLAAGRADAAAVVVAQHFFEPAVSALGSGAHAAATV